MAHRWYGAACAASIAGASLLALAVTTFAAPAASAGCPGAEVVFARGREEPPGVGYSLGAASADLVVAVTEPAFGFTNPLPPALDQQVAAVALFGNGTRGILGPVPDFSPAFAGKTIDVCAKGDPICSGGLNWPSHLQPSYIDSGLVDQAAGFVAARL